VPYQIIYSSQAAQPMTASELEKILVDARAGNEARDVTGALIYVDGVFLQILEGEKDTVLGLMKNIAKDTRHGSVKVFHEAEVEARTFGDWRMVYVNASPQQLSVWAGLPGTTTIEALLEGIGRDARPVAQVAVSILKTLAP